MKLASGQDPIPGQSRPIVHRASTQIDPQVAIFPSPDRAQALGDTRRGIPRGIAIRIVLRLRTQMEDININSIDGLFLFEIFTYDLIDQRVRDGGERGSDGGWGIGEMGFESFRELIGERRGGERDTEVEGMR